MYTYIYARPHKLLSFNSYHVKIKVTYVLSFRCKIRGPSCPQYSLASPIRKPYFNFVIELQMLKVFLFTILFILMK